MGEAGTVWVLAEWQHYFYCPAEEFFLKHHATAPSKVGNRLASLFFFFYEGFYCVARVDDAFNVNSFLISFIYNVTGATLLLLKDANWSNVDIVSRRKTHRAVFHQGAAENARLWGEVLFQSSKYQELTFLHLDDQWLISWYWAIIINSLCGTCRTSIVKRSRVSFWILGLSLTLNS